MYLFRFLDAIVRQIYYWKKLHLYIKIVLRSVWHKHDDLFMNTTEEKIILLHTNDKNI